MKATDFQATQGAVLGKAMERLEGETGLIKVLVSLQQKNSGRDGPVLRPPAS